MIKKTLVAVGGMSLLMVLFFGRDAVSYVRTSFGWVRDSVKSQVPVEVAIDNPIAALLREQLEDRRERLLVDAERDGAPFRRGFRPQQFHGPALEVVEGGQGSRLVEQAW